MRKHGQGRVRTDLTDKQGMCEKIMLMTERNKREMGKRQAPSLPKLKFMEGYYEEQAKPSHQDAAQEASASPQGYRRTQGSKWRT